MKAAAKQANAYARRWFAIMEKLHNVSEAMLRGNIGRAGTLAKLRGREIEELGRELSYQAERRRLGLDRTTGGRQKESSA